MDSITLVILGVALTVLISLLIYNTMHAKGHRLSAVRLLKQLHDGALDAELRVVWLREHLSKAGLSPEDIGTSEGELTRFLALDTKVHRMLRVWQVMLTGRVS